MVRRLDRRTRIRRLRFVEYRPRKMLMTNARPGRSRPRKWSARVSSWIFAIDATLPCFFLSLLGDSSWPNASRGDGACGKAQFSNAAVRLKSHSPYCCCRYNILWTMIVPLPAGNSVQPRGRAIHRFADRHQRLAEPDTSPVAAQAVSHTGRIRFIQVLLHRTPPCQSGVHLERHNAGW